jgi:carboxyl-terminal processing protease
MWSLHDQIMVCQAGEPRGVRADAYPQFESAHEDNIDMDQRPAQGPSRTYKAGLLVGAAFVAGLAAGPVSGLVERQLGLRVGLGYLGVERALADDSTADKNQMYRLLALLGDVIERVRADYVEPVKDKELIENAVNGMLTGLDAHSSYMNAQQFKDMQVQTKGEFGGLGIEVTQENGFIKVVSPIDDTPAARAGIKAGDLITAINGKTVQGLTLNEAVEKMRGPANSRISLTLKREGVDKPIEAAMNREVIKLTVVKSRLEGGDVAYIRLSQFTEQADTAIRKAFTQLKTEAGGHLKAVILDLRNDPGGLLDQAVAVAGSFIDRGEIVSTRSRRPQDGQRWDAKGGDITGGLPIVVLTNGGSASSSEIVAGALQDHRRAVLLGTRTFGKGSVQTVIPLPGNGAMRLTTARYYTPSGRSIQGLGIEPDVPVAATATEVQRFGPERESDLNRVLTNSGGTPQTALPPRTDLPAIAKDIPAKPPENFPAFDPAKPTQTDFQLQQALVVARAMAEQKRASN